MHAEIVDWERMAKIANFVRRAHHPRGSYVLPTSSELQRFGEADADIVLYSHTHRQLVRRIGRVLVVNPGSAGVGRNPHNGGQLSCAVLDTVTEEVVVHDFPALPVGRQPEHR